LQAVVVAVVLVHLVVVQLAAVQAAIDARSQVSHRAVGLATKVN
jgi:hypothetical protein